MERRKGYLSSVRQDHEAGREEKGRDETMVLFLIS